MNEGSVGDKVTTPKIDHSSNSTPIFEGKMIKEDTKK